MVDSHLKKIMLRKGYYDNMNVLKEAYWEAAEEMFKKFFFPDPELEKRFAKEKEAMFDQYIGEMYYAYIYEPYYVVSDLMGYDYEELWGWVEINLDEINKICRKAYKGDWTDLKGSKYS